MNENQKRVIVVGSAIIALMILIPPWNVTDMEFDPLPHVVLRGGYHFLFFPPEYEDIRFQPTLNLRQLGLQCAAVALLSVVAFFVLDKKEDEGS